MLGDVRDNCELRNRVPARAATHTTHTIISHAEAGEPASICIRLGGGGEAGRVGYSAQILVKEGISWVPGVGLG